MNNIKGLIILLSVLYAQVGKSQTTAIYDITFTSIWNAGDHTSIPPNAHWSKLVGATHKTENTFFQEGTLATTGIKNIAELGSNTVFNNEVITEITNTEADQYIDGASLATATGNILISNLMVSEDFPLLTLLSMIAPSPDWMIGVNGFNLLDGSNNWKISETIDLFALDSGTDDGTDYTSSNSVSNPFLPISTISGAPFQGNKIGTLTITFKGILGSNEYSDIQSINIFPNPNSNGQLKINNLGDVGLKRIDIYNLSGTQVKSFDNSLNQNNLTYDIQNLSKGVYVLKLFSTQDKLIVKKLVVE